MSSRRAVVLVNPAAGRGAARRAAEETVRILHANGWQARTVTGLDAADSRTRARRCVTSGVEVLAVAGGDGMVGIGLQAVAGTDTPLAVIPAGTGNDFARSLGIPRDDTVAAARLIGEGVRRSVDLGRCGDRWFGTVLTSGFDSLVAHRANSMTWPRGRARYNLAILAELARLRPLPFSLTLDGRALETEATLVAVGNGPYYGGGMRMCPEATLSDGYLAVTVVGAVRRDELVRVFPRVYRGTHITHPRVRTFRARSVGIDSPGVFGYADGEPVGDLPLRVDCVPGVVDVMTPGPGVTGGRNGDDGPTDAARGEQV
ncbi:diacylglycerol kinase [Streptomyces sp. 8N706]|uniref:diacylglycerol kinase n=1 Tax=Streptomyces sp. 8N706 TaxID=3457416 RepID=UPI003FD14026